jgi:hypothetical protein
MDMKSKEATATIDIFLGGLRKVKDKFKDAPVLF